LLDCFDISHSPSRFPPFDPSDHDPQVSLLKNKLESEPHNLSTAILSIDDFYLPHSAQQALAASHPQNPLVQHRGQPSTHDISLLKSTFNSLKTRHPVALPCYDKSAFAGQGDRTPETTWTRVNGPDQRSIDIIIFEGWCVGFRSLSAVQLESKWSAAVGANMKPAYAGRLGKLELESVTLVNEALRQYDEVTDMLDAFVLIDAEDTQYVYAWRLEQEAALRRERGSGMTDEQVVSFVNGYYPAYELYTEALRRGIFPGVEGRQLVFELGKDRRVKDVKKI